MHRPRDILSVRKESYCGDPFGTRRETVARVLFRDAAERDERKRRERVRHLSQNFEPDGRAVRALRRRVEDWAEDREVRAARRRAARLFARVRRDAYQELFAEGAT